MRRNPVLVLAISAAFVCVGCSGHAAVQVSIGPREIAPADCVYTLTRLSDGDTREMTMAPGASCSMGVETSYFRSDRYSASIRCPASGFEHVFDDVILQSALQQRSQFVDLGDVNFHTGEVDRTISLTMP